MTEDHLNYGTPKDYEPLRIVSSQAERIERDIDRLNTDLKPLRSFVLPGGSRAAAALHLCRTVSRRAERLMVALLAQEPEGVGRPALIYMNRLSDFFFVASRWANGRGENDVMKRLRALRREARSSGENAEEDRLDGAAQPDAIEQGALEQ